MDKKTEENKVEEGKELQIKEATSPVTMAQILLDKNVKPEDLEKMLILQERYEANQARKAYHVAMTAFKADPPEIKKDKRVKYETSKGTTEYNHVSLSNATGLINEALSKQGLSASWQPNQTEKDISVTCKITHILGHSEEATISAGPDISGGKNSIQAIASTITYLERYTLFALTGLAAGEDDDGRGSEPAECIDEQQLSTILDYVDSKNVDKARFCKHFKINSIEELPKSRYQEAVVMLEAK